MSNPRIVSVMFVDESEDQTNVSNDVIRNMIVKGLIVELGLNPTEVGKFLQCINKRTF